MTASELDGKTIRSRSGHQYTLAILKEDYMEVTNTIHSTDNTSIGLYPGTVLNIHVLNGWLEKGIVRIIETTNNNYSIF